MLLLAWAGLNFITPLQGIVALQHRGVRRFEADPKPFVHHARAVLKIYVQ